MEKEKRIQGLLSVWRVYPGRWTSISEMEGHMEVCKIRVSSVLGSVEFGIPSIHPAGTWIDTSKNRLEVTGGE